MGSCLSTTTVPQRSSFHGRPRRGSRSSSRKQHPQHQYCFPTDVVDDDDDDDDDDDIDSVDECHHHHSKQLQAFPTELRQRLELAVRVLVVGPPSSGKSSFVHKFNSYSTTITPPAATRHDDPMSNYQIPTDHPNLMNILNDERTVLQHPNTTASSPHVWFIDGLEFRTFETTTMSDGSNNNNGVRHCSHERFHNNNLHSTIPQTNTTARLGGRRRSGRPFSSSSSSIDAVFFVASLADFDEYDTHDTDKDSDDINKTIHTNNKANNNNRMVQTLNMFYELCQMECYRTSCIFLILNKADIFATKILTNAANNTSRNIIQSQPPFADYVPFDGNNSSSGRHHRHHHHHDGMDTVRHGISYFVNQFKACYKRARNTTTTTTTTPFDRLKYVLVTSLKPDSVESSSLSLSLSLSLPPSKSTTKTIILSSSSCSRDGVIASSFTDTRYPICARSTVEFFFDSLRDVLMTDNLIRSGFLEHDIYHDGDDNDNDCNDDDHNNNNSGLAWWYRRKKKGSSRASNSNTPACVRRSRNEHQQQQQNHPYVTVNILLGNVAATVANDDDDDDDDATSTDSTASCVSSTADE